MIHCKIEIVTCMVDDSRSRALIAGMESLCNLATTAWGQSGTGYVDNMQVVGQSHKNVETPLLPFKGHVLVVDKDAGEARHSNACH